MTVISDEKYSLLIILGNGFDLACGLESKYSDFFNDRFDKSNGFGAFFRDQKEITDSIALYGINDKLITLWDLIFWNDHHTNSLLIDRWADVEAFIHDYLKRFMQRTKEMHIEQRIPLFADCDNGSKWLNSVSERILFTAYSRVNGIRVFRKESIDVGGYWKAEESWINGTAWLFILFNELRLFEREFDNYLSRKAKDDRDSKFSAYAGKATHLYMNIIDNFASEEKNKHNAIVSFNYSIPFKSDELAAEGYENPDCLNIHGRLQAYPPIKGQKHEIIFGINSDAIDEQFSFRCADECQIPDLIYKFTKQSRLKDIGRNLVEEVDLETVKKIIFYGHSLADMDFFQFERIFDAVRLEQSDVKLIFLYSYYPGRTKEELDRCQQNSVRNLLAKYKSAVDCTCDLFELLSTRDRLVIEVLDEPIHKP